MDYQLINDKVLEVYMECNIREFPIDCIGILQHYNFRLLTYREIKNSNPELHKIALEFSDDAFQYERFICYNDSVTKGRVRFSLMHELGHYFLGHKETSEENEREADYFASSILAPRIAIWRIWHPTAEEIHRRFGLSYIASNRALDNFNRRKIYSLCDSEKKLAEWLFPPNVTIEKKEKSVYKEQHRRHKKEWAEIEARNKFIEEYYGSTTDFALEQYERSLHLGHRIYNI